MTQVHRIEGTDKLLMDTIRRQAGDLVDGWREGLQNGIDTDATEVSLEFDHETTVVQDNGSGVDLSSERGLELLKNLGETSKADDPDTIGEFGVGKGQLIAMGHAVWMSGTTALHFDIDDWGLECKTVSLPDDRSVDGLRVVVRHYPDEVPYEGHFRWDRYEENIRDRFRYAGMATGTDIVVNGDTVSDADPADEVGGDYAVVANRPNTTDTDFVAALQPSADGDIGIYSKGVYVKDVDGRGVEGVVVTYDNLRLNHARNQIQQGCPVWSEIEAWLDDTIEEILRGLPDSRLTAAARSYLAERAMSGDDFDPEAPMFKTVTGDNISLNGVRSAGQFAFARGDDQRARKLAEGWNMTILDTSDEATERLQSKIEEMREAMPMPDEFDVDEKADEVSLPDTHETLRPDELNTVQARKLAAARELADRMGVSETVRWGESEISDSWTDGSREIVLTDSVAPSRNRAAWLPAVFRGVVRESAHRFDSRNETGSGAGYNRRYTEAMEEHWGVLSRFTEECERDGLRDAVSLEHDHLLR